jgi:hypothetical protein
VVIAHWSLVDGSAASLYGYAMDLHGSCECGAIRFSVRSDAPFPYRICYCRRCRKIAGGTGAAINILADASTLRVEGEVEPSEYVKAGKLITSFCPACGSALFLRLADWPQWVYPFASAIDTDLPAPPHYIHIQTEQKPEWVPPHGRPGDPVFKANTEESIVDWHERLGLRQ